MFMVAVVFHSGLSVTRNWNNNINYGMVIESPTDEQSSTDSQNLTTEMSTEKKRHSQRVVGKPKLLCFVCNTKSG